MKISEFLVNYFCINQPFEMDGDIYTQMKWLIDGRWVTVMRIKPRTTNFKLAQVFDSKISFPILCFGAYHCLRGRRQQYMLWGDEQASFWIFLPSCLSCFFAIVLSPFVQNFLFKETGYKSYLYDKHVNIFNY